MKRKDWFLILTPLFVIWCLDHITKLWSISISQPFKIGFIEFTLYHNQGAFLGSFAELPPLLKIVSMSTIASFLVFSYIVIQYMLPIKSLRLRLGMSILLGGIIGNITDRILWGYVIDFFITDLYWFKLHPMNLADLSQWIGYGLIAMALIKEDEILWPPENNRHRLWINPQYQFRFIVFLLLVVLSFTLIGSIFSFTYFKATILELVGNNTQVMDRFLGPYLLIYLSISFTFCCFLVFLGRKVSHRNAGPIFAFDKYVSDLLEGRNRRFTLRAGDEFKQLEVIGWKIADYLIANKLIDEEDDVKTLTTQRDNAEDFSLGAVPVDGETPDYSTKQSNLGKTLANNARKLQIECPLCLRKPSLFHQIEDLLDWVECAHCKITFNLERFRKSSGATGLSSASDFNSVPEILETEGPSQKARLLKLAKKYFQDATTILEYQSNPARPEDPLLNHSRFDVVTITRQLEFCKNPKQLLNDCKQFINANGVLIVRTPNIQSWVSLLFRKKWIFIEESTNILLFNPASISRLLEACDYKVVSIEAAVTYLSIKQVRLLLKQNGRTWLPGLLRLCPEVMAEKLILPVPLGEMIVIAKAPS